MPKSAHSAHKCHKVSRASKSAKNGQKVPRVAEPQKILSSSSFGTPCRAHEVPIIQKKSEKVEDEDKQGLYHLWKKATDGWTAELMNRPNLLPSPSSSFLLDPFYRRTISYHKHERTCLGFILRIQEGFDIVIAHTQMKCHCAFALCIDGHWKWSPNIYFEIAARNFISIILYVVEAGNQVNIHDRQFYFHPVQNHQHCSFSPYSQGLLREVSFIVRFLILWYF